MTILPHTQNNILFLPENKPTTKKRKLISDPEIDLVQECKKCKSHLLKKYKCSSCRARTIKSPRSTLDWTT